jgi:hypothetical protein
MSQSRRSRAALKTVAVGLSAALIGLGFAAPAVAAGPSVATATAQAVNINLLSSAIDIAISNPATTATNDGSEPEDLKTGTPLISLLPNQGLLAAGALAETADAQADGTSYACAGVVSPGGGIQVGDGGNSCSVTGNGTGGVTLDLSKIPGVSGLLSSIATVTVSFDSLTARAVAPGVPAGQTVQASGDAQIVGATVHVEVLPLPIVGGITLDLPLALDGSVDENLLTAIVDSLTANGSPLLSGLIDTLSDGVAGVVSITVNHQAVITPADSGGIQPLVAVPDGQAFQVSALHLSLLSDAGATADIASVTVGPNVAGAPLVSSDELPIVIGGAGIIAMLALGVWAFRRRRVAAPSAIA